MSVDCTGDRSGTAPIDSAAVSLFDPASPVHPVRMRELTDPALPSVPRANTGWINGFIGMLIFSGSLPATRVAVLQFDPLFLTLARAAIAGLLACAMLAIGRERRPTRADLAALAIVAAGVVIAFPLLTALALRHVTAVHGIVFLGLLPLSTALFAVLRAGERPTSAFWIFSFSGAALVCAYAIVHGGPGTMVADGLMLAAVLACGLGYAEGGSLSRRLGGWQVICWALVLSMPLTVPLAWLRMPAAWDGIGAPAWIGLGYVSVFSMLVGFVFWYRGLAQGGVAAVGQLQLLQPFVGLLLAAGLLHEAVGPDLPIVLVGVIACVAAAKRFAR